MQVEIIKFLQSFHNNFWDKFFILSTKLGEETVYILIIAVLYWCYDKKFGFKLGITYLLSAYINGIFKDIFNSSRPIGVDGIRSIYLETATGKAFPSGHTQGVTAFWGYIIHNFKGHRLIKGIGFAIIALVGLSRGYLGLHWPIDILGGWVLGAAIVYGASRSFRFKSNIVIPMYIKVSMSIIVPLIVYGLYNTHEFDKLVGIIMGTLAGYFIEKDTLDFHEEGSLTKQTLKLIIGLCAAMAIRIGLKVFFPVQPIFEIVRYFLLGIWITLGAPWLFTVLKISNRKAKSPIVHG